MGGGGGIERGGGESPSAFSLLSSSVHCATRPASETSKW